MNSENRAKPKKKIIKIYDNKCSRCNTSIKSDLDIVSHENKNYCYDCYISNFSSYITR